MKTLKMNFICSIVVLQILFACNTVWTADADLRAPPLTATEDEDEAWMSLLKPEIVKGINDASRVDWEDIPENEDISENEEMDDVDGDVDDDVEMNDYWWNIADDDILAFTNQNFDLDEEELNDLLEPENRVHNKIEAEKFFRWSENGRCNKRKIDESLNESKILSDTAISKLEVVRSFIPRKSKHLTTNDLKNPENVLIATSHMFGTIWKNHTTSFYPSGDRKIYESAIGTYNQFLGNLTKERLDRHRVPLVCSDAKVDVIKGLDGKIYWDFTEFNIQKPVPEHQASDYCASDDSRTAVWPDLIWICDDAWPNHGMTLQEMIDDQKNQVMLDQRKDKIHWKKPVQLDDRMPSGGVMLHVLLHLFEILTKDFMVEKKYYPTMGKKSKAAEEDMVPTRSYGWCTALGNKDSVMKNSLKDRESNRNPQNLVWYATLVALDDVSWWRREEPELPVYTRRRRR